MFTNLVPVAALSTYFGFSSFSGSDRSSTRQIPDPYYTQKMTEATPNESVHRQLLVRCVVVNSDGELSQRYVEHNLFHLWRYVMEHRHQVEVLRSEHCLWLPAAEYERQRAYFDQTGRIEMVDRIHVAVFEPDSGIVHAQQRFVALEDASIATEALLRQYSDKQRASCLLYTSPSPRDS